MIVKKRGARGNRKIATVRARIHFRAGRAFLVAALSRLRTFRGQRKSRCSPLKVPYPRSIGVPIDTFVRSFVADSPTFFRRDVDERFPDDATSARRDVCASRSRNEQTELYAYRVLCIYAGRVHTRLRDESAHAYATAAKT